MHPSRIPHEELLHDCRRENTRGSGPGGQHRTRVATAVRLPPQPTGIMGQAYERRSQKDNARVALFRLRLNLAMDYRKPLKDCDFKAPYQTSEAWNSRRKGSKIRVNPKHDDFPALLAEALDLLHLHEDDCRKVAALLEVTVSQLVKFLGCEPRALNAVNQRRQKKGLKTYKV